MGATTTYGWRIPDLADPANAPAAFQAALQDAEDTVKDSTVLTYTPAWTSVGATQPSGATRQGWYRSRNGICQLVVSILGVAGVVGGTGSLRVAAPLPASTSIRRQIMPAYFVAVTAGGGVYSGFAQLTSTDGTAMRIYLPGSSSDTRMAEWRNATDGNAAGTGIPVVAGGYGMWPDSELVICGSYYL